MTRKKIFCKIWINKCVINCCPYRCIARISRPLRQPLSLHNCATAITSMILLVPRLGVFVLVKYMSSSLYLTFPRRSVREFLVLWFFIDNAFYNFRWTNFVDIKRLSVWNHFLDFSHPTTTFITFFAKGAPMIRIFRQQNM